MKNTNLAFEYLKSLLFQDINADQKVAADNQFSENEKQELLSMMNVIKNMYQQQQNPELQNIQFESLKKNNQIYQKNVENTFDTMMSLKTSIQDVISDAKKAYKFVLWMYVLAFYLGVVLILSSIVFAAYGKTILSIAFGSIGLIDIVSHFIFKPPLELQNSRANLAQLMVILTNWFSDIMNLNSYYSTIGQGGNFEMVERLSTIQNENTAKMLDLIKKYCEPGEHLKNKAKD